MIPFCDQKLEFPLKLQFAQLCLTLCDPKDCIVYGISRAEYWNG